MIQNESWLDGLELDLPEVGSELETNPSSQKSRKAKNIIITFHLNKKTKEK